VVSPFKFVSVVQKITIKTGTIQFALAGKNLLSKDCVTIAVSLLLMAREIFRL
jgi:hypothetical protein